MAVADVAQSNEVQVSEAPKAKPTRTGEDQLVYVKVVRAFAMIVIVTLHVAFPLIYLYNTISYSDWWVGNNFYIWGKIGSPLFTMVSGLLLLNPDKDQPIPVFFKKRFAKVLFPFLAWAGLYLLWRIFFKGEEMTAKEIATTLIEGPVYYHLWFIQMILGLYLATPILRIYVRAASRENLSYFLLVWFIAASILPISKRFFGVEVGIDIVVTTEFVGFFILGHYLRDLTLTRKQLLPVLLGVVALMVFTQVATHAMTVQNGGTFDNFFVLNDSFNLVLAGIGLFLFFKSLDYDLIFSKLPFIKAIVMGISGCSLGIYFVHVMVIELLASGVFGFKLEAAAFNPLVSIPVISALVLLLSFTVVTVMKRIPLVRQIVP